MEEKCKTIILKCPVNFIKFNSPTVLDKSDYKNQISIDECLKNEILYLWSKGVKTTGCCCGHNSYDGFISVTEDCYDMMYKLGYKLWNWEQDFFKERWEQIKYRPEHTIGRLDTFKAKTQCIKSLDGE